MIGRSCLRSLWVAFRWFISTFVQRSFAAMPKGLAQFNDVSLLS
jgi:hypothetical protein